MVLMNKRYAISKSYLTAGKSVKVEDSLLGSMSWLPISVNIESTGDLASDL